VAASLGVGENAVVFITTSAGSTVVDFSVAGAGDVAGRLRENGLSTTHLTRFNGGVPVAAESSRRGWQQGVPAPVAGGGLAGE